MRLHLLLIAALSTPAPQRSLGLVSEAPGCNPKSTGLSSMTTYCCSKTAARRSRVRANIQTHKPHVARRLPSVTYFSASGCLQTFFTCPTTILSRVTSSTGLPSVAAFPPPPPFFVDEAVEPEPAPHPPFLPSGTPFSTICGACCFFAREDCWLAAGDELAFAGA